MVIVVGDDVDAVAAADRMVVGRTTGILAQVVVIGLRVVGAAAAPATARRATIRPRAVPAAADTAAVEEGRIVHISLPDCCKCSENGTHIWYRPAVTELQRITGV